MISTEDAFIMAHFMSTTQSELFDIYKQWFLRSDNEKTPNTKQNVLEFFPRSPDMFASQEEIENELIVNKNDSDRSFESESEICNNVDCVLKSESSRKRKSQTEDDIFPEESNQIKRIKMGSSSTQNNSKPFNRSISSDFEVCGQVVDDDVCENWPSFILLPDLNDKDYIRGKIREVSALFPNSFKETELFEPNLTHIVFNNDNEVGCRTLKTIFAMLDKKKLVRVEWLTASLEQKKVLKDEPYLIQLPFTHNDPNIKNLFKGFKFCFPFGDLNKGIRLETWKQLLSKLGATLVSKDATDVSCIILIGDNSSDKKKIQDYFLYEGHVTIHAGWIKECIVANKILPFSTKAILTDQIPLDHYHKMAMPQAVIEANEGNEDFMFFKNQLH